MARRTYRNKLFDLQTIGVAIAIYYYTSNDEQDAFTEHFFDESQKVLDALGGEMDRSLGVVDAFVVGLVSHARSSNQTWPFVTLPDFAVQAAKTRCLSKSSVMNLYNLVTDDDRERWQNYSLSNDGWVSEALETQKNDPNFHGTLLSDFESYGTIFNNYGDSEINTGPYLPVWQTTPVIPVFRP